MQKYTIPTLIINESIARANIKRMAKKARNNGLSFEPHFKTHQSKEVGEWFRDEGVEAITVSSISMAKYFAANGWNKITIAFPVNILEINELSNLSKSVALTILVQDREVLTELTTLGNTVNIFIEIGAGYHRSGVMHDELDRIGEIISSISNSKHYFKGFYCHAGHSYKARSSKSIKVVYEELESIMSTLKSHFIQHKPHIAVGDTPTCSVVDSFKGIDSIHPGNFVYYDYTQIQIGSCNLSQVAAYLLWPIVAIQKDRNELIMYGGGVHLSKEAFESNGSKHFGLVGQLDENGNFEAFKESYVKSISQEHGIVFTTPDAIVTLRVGDLVAILPIHSCMTVDCMQHIFTEKGKLLSKLTK